MTSPQPYLGRVFPTAAPIPQRRRVDASFPEVLDFLFVPKRYKVPYGGRGSAKSWSIAQALLMMATERPLRVLCVREFQNSITESVHQLLSDQIVRLGLSDHFIVQTSTIIGINGSEFIFAGIRNNTNKIRSFEGVDICWVEEAEKVSDRSWEILIPTIRKEGSEIWISFNPDEETDPTYQRFIVNPPDATEIISKLVNWTDNPWFPEVLRKEKDYLARVDPDAYEHVWNGRVRTNLSAQIFRGKYSIQSFDVPDALHTPAEERWDGPYFGLDFGFANDPCALMKMWIVTITVKDSAVPKRMRLMVEWEASGIGVEIDDLPDLLDKVPAVRDYKIRADNSRPETISHLARHGFQCEAADKWQGCVEDRIAFLRAFEQIIIHPRCKRNATEARLYSYKRDRLTGDVLAEIEDKHNHTWDAIGYALTPLVQRAGNMGVWAALAG